MRFGVNLDKSVIVALHAHGVAPKQIAEYLMRDAVAQVTVEVNKAVTAVTSVPTKKETA